ncbi:MAG TPA: FGGY family carbohydrate kinase, partial [Candidatus Limnocylindrales bacterium]
PGWAQQDALAWRRALAEVIGGLLRGGAITGSEVGALGLASQVDGLVAVDADAEPLLPAIIWLDRRATDQTRALRASIDEGEVRRITGLNTDASHVAPKIRWLQDAHPHVVERAVGLLLPGSALVAWLTGEQVVDHANASSTLLYDVTTRDWSDRMQAATGIDVARLGTIRGAAEVVGPLRPRAAERLGLTTATRVVVGTGDEHGATLGAGGIRPGIVVDITGTAEPVCVAATTPVIDETGLVETHGHADDRVWLVENPGFVSGGSVTWFRDAIGGGASPRDLDAAAAAVAPGADGITFLPTLSGATAPRWNDRARGVYAGLSLNHGTGHLFRALLEGCTFALRDIVDRLDALDLAAEEIRVVGGGARSPLWLQMKADVTGRRVRVLANDESTAVGAAMLAGVGTGTFADLDDAVARLAVLAPSAYEPDAGVQAGYEDAYGRYRRAFDALEPEWDRTGTDA